MPFSNEQAGDLIDAIRTRMTYDNHISDVTQLIMVYRAALAYRAEEQTTTPRICRGEKLQSLANALDDCLAQFDEVDDAV